MSFLKNTVNSLNALLLTNIFSTFTPLFDGDAHAVGIDIHQEILLMKDINSKRSTIRGSKKTSFFPPPEELYIIDDDESNSHASAEDLDISNKSKREIDSM